MEQQINPGTENKWGIFFRGFGDKRQPKYPSWRYHKFKEPILVNNTEEDEKHKSEGYEPVTVPISANKNISNWFWDLEDMSAKQLVVFAKDEFDLDLPFEAGQERLLKAVLEITKLYLHRQNSIVFMAHTIKMDYDAVLKEIRQSAEKGFSEVETRVIEI